jgi:hypothetical protein
VAITLVAIGIARHYGADPFPPDMRGMISKALGGAESMAHLAILCVLLRGAWPVMLSTAWYAWENAQVVACSIWYIFEPWTVPVGKAMCSARAGYDFGILGAAVAAGVLGAIYRWGRR